jgi:ADP-heptose:LPS heptosyltransferase
MLASPPKHVIYVRPDAIGDAVLSAGMLPALRELLGSATQITVVCQERVTDVYASCPHINSVIAIDKERLCTDQAHLASVVSRLRSLGADVCLHPVYSRDPVGDFLAINSGCPTRVGHAGDLSNLTPELQGQNNRGYSHLVPNNPADLTELQHHQRFLAALGISGASIAPMIWTSAADAAFADQVMQHPPLAGRQVIAIAAAGLSPIKFYSDYGAALRNVANEHGFALVALGASSHHGASQAQLHAAGAPHVNLCGQTTLTQAAEILRRCRMYVGADTATAHIACAVGVPNVVLLGGGHFGRFFPYSPLTTIACLPIECYGCNWVCRYHRPHCIRDVRPEVLDVAIRTALSSPATKPRVVVQGNVLWPAHPSLPRWGLRRGLINESAVDFIVAEPATSA